MGEWFSAHVLDVARGWVGSSKQGGMLRMSLKEIEEYQAMQSRHSQEEQDFLGRIFRQG